MADTGKISDGNLSNPKKPLNRRNYYIDRKPQETLDNRIKQRSVNESKPKEIFKDYIWNTISSDVREKQTLFYQAKTDFEQKKATIDLIEKQKEVKGAEEHVKLKEYKKESKIKDIKKQEKSYYELKSAVKEIEQRLAPCLQDYKQAYSEKSADYKGRLLEQTRYIESLKSEIEKSHLQVAEFRDSKARLLVDIDGLEIMLKAKEDEHKHLEEKCAQSEKSYEDVNKKYEDIKTQIQILNQKIANEEASQRDLEKQLAPIRAQQKELQLKIESIKEMQISGVLDEETSDSLKNKMAEKEKHLVQLQKEVKAHKQEILSKKTQKDTLEVKMVILHYKIKNRNILEIHASELEKYEHNTNMLEDMLDANERSIGDNRSRNDILEYKRKDLELLRSIYLREEFKDQEEHQIEEDQLVLEAKIAEKEKAMVEKERYLAEHQKKIADIQKDIQNSTEDKQNLVKKGNKADEIEIQIKNQKDQLAHFQDKEIQLDLEVKIAYIEKEIAYVEKEIVDNKNEVLHKQADSDKLQEDIHSYTKDILDIEEQYKHIYTKNSCDIYEIVPADVREQYDKMYPGEKLEESLLMLSGLNAHIKDSRNKYESQERNIQEQRREVQERLPDLNEKAALRENESFKRYFGLKNIIEAFRQNRNRDQDQEAVDDTSLEYKNKRMETIVKEIDTNQDRIFFISNEIGNRERSISELQNKMRKAQEKKTQNQGLLSQFIERKAKLEQAVNKPEKENISKICKIIKEMEKSLHEQDKMLASYSKQEAGMWKDLYDSAETKLSLLNKDNEYQLEYISISNKIDKRLSRELENLQKSYEEVSDKYQTEKSEIEARIQKASENAKNDLDLNLQNLQKTFNEKNKQIEQIYQELKILPLEIQNKEQQEINQRRELQEQLTRLTPQSSHFSNKIATISQALEGYQKELEESRVDFAKADQEKVYLEKKVEHTKRKLEELYKQLEDAKTQLQQKSKEHNDISECLIKAVEEQKQPQDRLVKAQEERQTLEEKYNKDLENLKRKDKDLNNSISTQYKSILDLHTMKISPLEEELAKADHELTQARQELEHAKAEQHIAWSKVSALREQQKSPIEVQYLSTELQDAQTELRNAQTELHNAMREACEEIILQFTSNDEVRARLGEAKVEAMASREYRPNYGRAIEKHRDLASQYGLAMKEYEKRLEEEEKNLSNLNKVILNLRKKSEENSKFAKMVGCALKMMEREIDIYKEKNRIINNDHNRSEKDYEASNQAKELQKIQLESTKQELEEARNQLEDASIQLQEKLKERNNFSSLLTKKTEERKQQEILLAKAEKERKAIVERCEKAKKAMKNLDKFLEDLR